MHAPRGQSRVESKDGQDGPLVLCSILYCSAAHFRVALFGSESMRTCSHAVRVSNPKP